MAEQKKLKPALTRRQSAAKSTRGRKRGIAFHKREASHGTITTQSLSLDTRKSMTVRTSRQSTARLSARLSARSSKSEAMLNNERRDPEKEYRRIIKEIMRAPRQPQDWKDYSNHPSYTHLVEEEKPLSLGDQPLNRIQEAKKLYERQFQHEIKLLARHQAKASDAINFLTHMRYTTLWPPLHSRQEIDSYRKYLPQHTPEERLRIRYIMKNNIE